VSSSIVGIRFSSVCFASSQAAGGTFSIDASTGVVRTVAALDYEAQQRYGVEVQVVDVPGTAALAPANLFDFGVLSISVVDVNEAPFWNAGTACPAPSVVNTGAAQTSISGSSFVGCLQIPENSNVGVSAGTLAAASDPDSLWVTSNGVAQTLQYSLATTNNLLGSAPLFNVGPSSRIVSLAQSALNFESANIFALSALVNDAATAPSSFVGMFATSGGAVALYVTDVNESPVLAAQACVMPEQTVLNNAPSGTQARCGAGGAAGPLVAADPDTAGSLWASLTFSVTGGTGAALFSINGASGVVSSTSLGNASSLNFEGVNSFTLIVRVVDGGGLAVSSTMTINLLDVNEPPTLLGPFSRNMPENVVGVAAVGAVVSVSDDDAGQTVSFTVTGGTGASLFQVDACSGQISLKSSAMLHYNTTQLYTVELTVADSGSPTLSDKRIFTVSAVDVNDAPTVDAQSRTVPENTASGLVGAPLVVSDPDSFGGFLPWITQTWTIVGGNAQGIFAIHNATGQLSVASGGAGLLNFENSNQKSFVLTVQAMDGGGMSVQAAIMVSVTDVNEAPVFTDATLLRSIDENCARSPRSVNGPVGAIIAAADPDTLWAGGVQALSYSIISGNGAGFFNIIESGAGAGQIRVSAAGASASFGNTGLDFETTPSYTLVLRVADPAGLSSTAAVVVNLNNRNEAPWFLAGTSQARVVAENAPATTAVGAAIGALDYEETVLSYSITGGNGLSVFGINAVTGQIFVQDSTNLNYETTPTGLVVTLTVRVTDSGLPEGASASMAATATVVITVVDVNEPPVMLPMSFAIAENSDVSLPGARFGSTTAGSVVASTVLLSLQVADPDFGDTRVFSIVRQDADSAGTATPFSVSGNQLTVALSGTSLDFEAARSRFIVLLRVTDKGGITSDANVTVTLTNVNELCTWSAQAVSFFTPASLETDVGTALSSFAYDQDLLVAANLESLAFAISNVVLINPPSLPLPVSTTFTMNAATGQLSVTPGYSPNIVFSVSTATGAVFNLTVTVRDTSARIVSRFVTVTVSNNNRRPVVSAQALTIAEYSDADVLLGNATGIGSLVGYIIATDADFTSNQTLTYTLAPAGPNINRPFPFAIVTESSSIAQNNENAVASTVLGTVSAVDPDSSLIPSGMLRYALVQNAEATPFAIDAVTGRMSLQSAGLLDFESKALWQPTIRCSDTSAQPFDITLVVPISVLDNNDLTVTGIAFAPGAQGSCGGQIPSSGSMSLLFPTPGGCSIIISGTNFGVTAGRAAAAPGAQAIVSVSYGTVGTEYVPTCVIYLHAELCDHVHHRGRLQRGARVGRERDDDFLAWRVGQLCHERIHHRLLAALHHFCES
jgi:hypothetical protein